jgi:acyl dehydratase
MSRGDEPSTLRAALRLVAQGVQRRRGGGGSREAAPKRRLAVERAAVRVDPARLRRYLAVTSGDRIPALTGEGAPLPPTLPCLWETALALELLSLAEIGFPAGGLIHMESELVPLRSLYPSDLIRARVELDRVEDHPRGRLLVLKARCWNGAGQLCQESVVSLLARNASGSSPRPASGSPAPAPPEPAAGDWRTLSEWDLPGNLGRRYARVSGDFNPIHLWPWSARLLGFRRPLLHGFCTQAVVAHALIAELLGGDPRALRRLQISFRAPLFLPARIRLLVEDGTGSGGRFRLVDSGAPTRRPYAEGSFAGSA